MDWRDAVPGVRSSTFEQGALRIGESSTILELRQDWGEGQDKERLRGCTSVFEPDALRNLQTMDRRPRDKAISEFWRYWPGGLALLTEPDEPTAKEQRNAKIKNRQQIPENNRKRVKTRLIGARIKYTLSGGMCEGGTRDMRRRKVLIMTREGCGFESGGGGFDGCGGGGGGGFAGCRGGSQVEQGNEWYERLWFRLDLWWKRRNVLQAEVWEEADLEETA